MGFESLLVIIFLILSVVIHEVSHGYAANALGDPTARLQGRLTLNPLNHLDPVGSVLVPLLLLFLPGGLIFGWARPVPYNPYNLRNQRWGEALVAVAGPAVNILIAVLFSLVIRFGLGVFPPSFIDIASLLVFINLILAFFNLLPIPPLDGSKILFALLPQHMQRFRLQLEQYGFFLVLLFIFFFWNTFAPLVFNTFVLLTGISF